MSDSTSPSLDGFSRLIGALMGGPLPAIAMVVALGAGVVALSITPREEEPQIIVPVADVLVSAPGLPAAQVERQVTTPLEQLLYQIDGVEHVYSASQAGRSVVTVRFHVGEDREDSLVKIHNKLQSNTDRIPAVVSAWVVKAIEIDDVPILVASLWSDDPVRTDDHRLRRLAEEIALELQAVADTGPVSVTGGRRRSVRIELDPQALAARQTAALDVAFALEASNVRSHAGDVQRLDRNLPVDAGIFVDSPRALERLVVNVVDGLPVYLADVATVDDGPEEPLSYSWITFGPAAGAGRAPQQHLPAVAIAVAKKKGTNAVVVARDVRDRLEGLQRDLFPPEVKFTVIRDYGKTANDKVDNLVASLGVSVLTVIVFLGIFIGWRPALVVGLAVPICYCAALALDLAAGYTINRVTLFALILSLGLIVDDPITSVDNIDRYFRIGKLRPARAVLAAMAEVRGALIMSTLAIIVSFAPLFFITGMMGPYMAPMAFNVPVTVTISTLVAFLITPWLAYRLLDHRAPSVPYDVRETVTYRAYSRIVGPLVRNRTRAVVFLALVGVAFAFAVALPAQRLVPLKLLPHDNKNEFQVVVDMPEGTTLERTQAVAGALADRLRSVPEVIAVAGFVGDASPMDFNGMIRQHYLRDRPHQADLRVVLAPGEMRSMQSHEMLLRIRRELEAIALDSGARIKLTESPPGPPVVSTIVAEVYGEPATAYRRIEEAALGLSERIAAEPLVVDVDTSVDAPHERVVFVTDKEKAALSGIATSDVARTVALATGGLVAGHLQLETEAQPLPIVLRLPIERRSSLADLSGLYVKGRPGVAKVREKGGVRDAAQPLVQLAEIGAFELEPASTTIFHKDTNRVAYVFADTAGRPPAEAIIDTQADRDAEPGGARELAARTYLEPGGGKPWSVPGDIRVVWTGEGEWQITLRVFRDLGIAFGVALIGIFLILYLQTRLASLTAIIMIAIPLSVIGIMPGFWALNSFGLRSVEGFPNPVLFTATAMIGMIALSGIVVRNSLVLIEFVQLALRRGAGLQDALIEAGATRMRPIFLTAATTLLGNVVITLDPIFSGLAWSIIFGIVASTVFTLVVVPVVYFLAYARSATSGLPAEGGLDL